MKRRLIAGQCALVLALACPSFAVAAPPSLTIEKVNTSVAQVVAPNGVRGAALAQLSDGRLLLGGGKNGSNLYLYDRKSESLTTLGRVIKASERINESSFAITDIAILRESGNLLSLLVSFPEYNRAKSCASLVLYRYELTLSSKPKLTRGARWFRATPCVSVDQASHAAGRIEVIDSKSAYLTVGDMNYKEIENRKLRGALGSIYRVDGKIPKRVSEGHRNPQGILLIGNNLYNSEHGPRGGDEINLVEQGQDYGWPFVTFGEPYGSSTYDYGTPIKAGAHDGFTKPLFYWVPSVAPTELIQLPQNSAWGKWAGQIVMGTLRENALIFIELTSTKVVGEVSNVNVSERIRDLEVDSEGTIIATTDSGELLFISPS